MQEVEDLQGMTVKIHKVSSFIKEIEQNLEQVAQHLWTSDEISSMEKVPVLLSYVLPPLSRGLAH